MKNEKRWGALFLPWQPSLKLETLTLEARQTTPTTETTTASAGHLDLLLRDGLESALLLLLEHTRSSGLFDHAQDLRRLHVEHFCDASLVPKDKKDETAGAGDSTSASSAFRERPRFHIVTYRAHSDDY